jgi:hypothetical protein
MTNEEVIRELKSRKLKMSMCIDIESCRSANNAIDIAINSIQENTELKAEIKEIMNIKKSWIDGCYGLNDKLKKAEAEIEQLKDDSKIIAKELVTQIREIEQLKSELEQSVKGKIAERIIMSKTHNKSNTKIYRVWNGIKQRCNNPNDGFYYCYGLKGIKICEEWSGNFSCFYDWSVKNGYKEGLTIDRVNNDGNYEPSNCRWVDNITQQRNRGDRKRYEFNGEKLLLCEISELTGIKLITLYMRIRRGHGLFLSREEAEQALKCEVSNE